MAKVSASTLVRRASKTKDKAVAKRLRTQAARMRREERAAAQRDREVKTVVVKVRTLAEHAAAGQSAGQPAGAENGASVGSQRPPTRIELPDIYNAEIDDLRRLATQEDGERDVFGARLRSLVNSKIKCARHETEDAMMSQMKTVAEAQRINVVCAFLAEIEGTAALNKGPLPTCLMVSGYTLARVVDALREAGYTANGKEGMKRHG